MALKITFLGHAGFVLTSGEHAVAIDPFLTGNPLARHKPSEIACSAIALTHGHADHFGPDTLEIAKANGATIYAPFELAEYCGEQGCTVEPANPGGRLETDFGWIAFTPALHSSSYEGRYMGAACGVVVHMDGVSFYHLGDTALFSDLKLISELYLPDVAAIPVGDRFTMGPELGTKAAEVILPRVAIPIHYKTFPLLAQDISAFAPEGVEVKVMEPGDIWTYE